MLRHPRRGRPARRRGDAADRAATDAPGRAGLLRSRRARRSACRGRSSSRTSTGPARPGCAACRTPARPPGRRRSGTRCTISGAERIGHGITAAQDPRAARAPGRAPRSPLEVCPTSNVAHPGGRHPRRAPAARSWSRAGRPGHHQLRRPADVRHHLNNEYAVAARLLGLDDAGVAGLARDAVDRVLPRPGRQARLSSPRSTPTRPASNAQSLLDPAGEEALSAEIDASAAGE